MKIPNGYKLIEERKINEITLPYDLLPHINANSGTDSEILKSWVKHMKNKNKPYCIVSAGTKIVLYVQKTGF